jgi:glycine/D-amino acid oxidase-like deaminating enzyme
LSSVRSYWLNQALSKGLSVCPALRHSERADVAILGGGFCGLWTAIELKAREPALSIVVVERDICGGGASGRCAGYVLDLWAKFLALRSLYGTDDALRICRAAAAAIVEIGEVCRLHGIDANFQTNGWLWGATCARHRKVWTGTMMALESLGEHPFSEVSSQDLHERYGLRGHVAAVQQATVAQVQPANLALGLRRVALEMGVRIFEHSRVTGVVRGKTCVVQTEKGSVSAFKVVIAMNAWGIMFPEIRRGIAVTAAEACVTVPIPDVVSRLGWATGPAITDSRRMLVNYRATPDGRVEMGKGGGILAFGSCVGPKFDGRAIRVKQIIREVVLAVPALKGIPIEGSWIGPIDKSFFGVPAAGRFPKDENIFYGCGFSGNGVGPSKLIAKILASLVLGRKDEWSSLGLAQPLQGEFPREPLRYVGGQLVRAAVDRNDRLDNLDREPDFLTRWLVSKMPGQLIPQKDFETGAS